MSVEAKLDEVLLVVREVRDGLSFMLGAMEAHTGMLTQLAEHVREIRKACSDDADIPPSPLLEPLRELVETCQQTNELIRDQPERFREVIREELAGPGDC